MRLFKKIKKEQSETNQNKKHNATKNNQTKHKTKITKQRT